MELDRMGLPAEGLYIGQAHSAGLNYETAKAAKNREVWIDVIRGVTMLLVIYSHVCRAQLTNLNSIFITTRMPLFFFISGFFMYSAEYGSPLLVRRLKSRLIKQLYPTLIFFTLFVIFCCNGRYKLIYNEGKAGYWFTYVSVLYFFTLAPVLYLFSRYKLSSARRLLILLSIACISYIVQLIGEHLDIYGYQLSRLLSFRHYILYLRLLILGSVFRILWNKYHSDLIKWPCFLLSVIGFIICYNSPDLLFPITKYFGIYSMLFIFYKMSAKWFDSKMFRGLGFIGSMTLEIYLLHYFVLKFARNFEIYNYVTAMVKDTFLEFPVILLFSVIIAVVCIMFTKILRRLHIHKYLFGK